MDQVSYFMEIYGHNIKDDHKKFLLEGYSNLLNTSKFKRVTFCIKNRIMKKGVIRKIMQVLWM